MIHNLNSMSHVDIYYFLGQDLSNILKNKSKDNFFILQGHHANIKKLSFDLFLPNKTFLEKEGLFLNLEGSILKTNIILQPPVLSRND